MLLWDKVKSLNNMVVRGSSNQILSHFFVSVNQIIEFELGLRQLVNVKKRTIGKCQFLQKSAKSPVSYINWVHFFILFSHGFT